MDFKADRHPDFDVLSWKWVKTVAPGSTTQTGTMRTKLDSLFQDQPSIELVESWADLQLKLAVNFGVPSLTRNRVVMVLNGALSRSTSDIVSRLAYQVTRIAVANGLAALGNPPDPDAYFNGLLQATGKPLAQTSQIDAGTIQQLLIQPFKDEFIRDLAVKRSTPGNPSFLNVLNLLRNGANSLDALGQELRVMLGGMPMAHDIGEWNDWTHHVDSDWPNVDNAPVIG